MTHKFYWNKYQIKFASKMNEKFHTNDWQKYQSHEKFAKLFDRETVCLINTVHTTVCCVFYIIRKKYSEFAKPFFKYDLLSEAYMFEHYIKLCNCLVDLKALGASKRYKYLWKLMNH